MGYNIITEYRISNKPFDICLPEQKILFEFNGTYWHLDPRVYEYNFYDKSRKIHAWQIWHKDKLKTMCAIKRGYRVIPVWQIDWDSKHDKTQFLREVINRKSDK